MNGFHNHEKPVRLLDFFTANRRYIILSSDSRYEGVGILVLCVWGKMSYLSHFQRGQIIGVRLLRASITATAKMLGVSRDTVSKVMTAYQVEGKTSSGNTEVDESQSSVKDTVRC